MMSLILGIRIFILLLPLISLSTWAGAFDDLQGKVVGITDGDTLTLLDQRRQQTRIRLSDIDTPEHGQPYGQRAR
jgi:micrococcal nuclease